MNAVKNDEVDNDERFVRYCAGGQSFEVKRYKHDKSQRVTSSLTIQETQASKVLSCTTNEEDATLYKQQIQEYHRQLRENEKKMTGLLKKKNELQPKINAIEKSHVCWSGGVY